MVKRIFAIGFIFACSAAAWWTLSLSMGFRTQEKSYSMSDAVGDLWGTAHHQVAPFIYTTLEEGKQVEMNEEEKLLYLKRRLEEENLKKKIGQRSTQAQQLSEKEFVRLVKETRRQPLELASSDLTVDLHLDYRKKGLLWFSTYTVDFNAAYRVQNPFNHPTVITAEFPFPSASAVYDNLAVEAEGHPELKSHVEKGGQEAAGKVVATLVLPPNAEQTFRFRYRSRGLDQWTYQFSEDTDLVKNFAMTMTTNFDAIDFPRNSISPDQKAALPNHSGWKLNWKKDSMVSGFQIGMVMPQRLNPGPLAASMSNHAPVSLFFFFFLLFLLQVMRELKIHPMNYFFLAASFFAFNLLFSYLVDHLDVKAAFLVSSLVSIFLVVSYLRLVVSAKFALLEASLAQLVFQILFSFAHFFEGYTGLTITIGAVITLAVAMRLTAKLDWEKVFAVKKPDPAAVRF